MPRKPLFRTNNKTEGKTTNNNKPVSETTITSTTPPPEIAAWIEAALEKANTAVLFDFTGSPKQAMESYNEAIDLLKKVFEVSDKNDDQTRLKKIYESYIERVGILSLQLDNNELDDSPSLTIPIAKEPPKIPITSEKVLPPIPQPSLSSSTTTTTSINNNKKTKKSSPLPLDLNSKSLKLPQKSPKILSSKSSSGSLFSNMFAKKSQSDLHHNDNNNNNKITSSIFSMPTPSKSTPTLSLNRSNLSSWKKSNKKKNQHQSTEMDALDIHSSQIELPSLPILPPTTHSINNNDDDYFDLQSMMSTKDLLYSQPEPMLESLRDLHQKNMSALDIDLNNTNIMNNNINISNNNNNNNDTGGINSNKSSLEIPEPPLMSNNSSNDTYFSNISINNNINNKSQQNQQQSQQQPLASSASSIITTSTSFTKSIYSPNRSSFYSTAFSYRLQDDDDYSIASSKNPVPLFLNNDLLNFGNDNDSSFDMESFAKVLADSAATMPDRHHRRKNTSNNNNTNNNNNNNNNTVNTIKEMENEDIDNDVDDNDDQFKKSNNKNNQQLSRSASNKSVASSTKSYDSSMTGRSSTSSHTPPPLPNLPIIPTPSTSSKSTKSEYSSTFWSKKSKTTKPKTFKPLAPINILDNNNENNNSDDNDVQHKNKNKNKNNKKIIPSALSSIISPPPMTASTINSDIISPITPTTSKSFSFGIISPSNSTSKITSSSSTASSLAATSNYKNRHRSTSINNNNKGVDMKISMGDYLHNEDNKQPKLMGRLLQSMEEGGFITDKIHAPKQLWYQTHVRLPAIDAKINSCEQILTILYRMQSRSINQHNDSDALEDFNRLEFILDNIKQTFGKVNYDHHQQQQQASSSTNNDSSSSSIIPSTSNELQKQHQSLHSKSIHINNNNNNNNYNNNNNNNKDSKTTWSSKLSKSVERMKMDNKPTEEQLCTYIKTLIRLFSLASVLDEWRDKYMDMTRTVSMEKAYIYDLLLQKSMMCTGTLHSVVCSFVMRDFAILLNKWLKRSREWLFDD